MQSVKILTAAAVIGAQLVAGQSSACRNDFTITSVAQATNIPCATLEKDLIVDSTVSGNLVVEGITRIRGSFIITNASAINQLSSTTLRTIDQEFHLEALTQIRGIQMPALTDIGSIRWIHLPELNSIQLGQSGVTSATEVEISDTALSSLSEFKVSSVSIMKINNNDRLQTYESTLANVTDELTFSSNGADLVVSLPDLIWANNLGFTDVAEVNLPALQYINDSIRFDDSSLTSFSAPNLTTVEKGDLAFVANLELGNLTFPSLTQIGGSLTLINNTALETVDGFPLLEEVGGAIRLGGNFQNVSLPALERAAGDFVLASTGDITDTCKTFESMEGDQIKGGFACRGDDDKANDENEVNTDGGSNGGGNGGSSNNDDSAAGTVSANMLALVAAGAIGIFAQLL
ncbi:hypothetical protein F5X68DRAFT_1374 [Plectosphaerella plurivora]|uniref:Uncharacterized protein n=1 Tax=Plectosphaerella plurivora TaxID=936078 RepID=A0A9P8VM66_9PEZI|nr:hypothetical protein F5X68DRAFT_1374 [Plectosphaerella plurivora]